MIELIFRTPLSWLKITVFYMIYYTFLACFWIACLVIFFQVNDKDKYKFCFCIACLKSSNHLFQGQQGPLRNFPDLLHAIENPNPKTRHFTFTWHNLKDVYYLLLGISQKCSLVHFFQHSSKSSIILPGFQTFWRRSFPNHINGRFFCHGDMGNKDD